jgi:hypothetical protein
MLAGNGEHGVIRRVGLKIATGSKLWKFVNTATLDI